MMIKTKLSSTPKLEILLPSSTPESFITRISTVLTNSPNVLNVTNCEPNKLIVKIYNGASEEDIENIKRRALHIQPAIIEINQI